ncbi:hypothetical protein DL546_001125 [Coniochaeta pulveracea]|uniref:Chitin-binding type-1 domain-containing protein n=1 Tax=Coniochaeta pulveracea TaxID=177199 RepID=A0A420Y869_9PEZI|nr:hypothetical protein DL546_001125 [Coniochaeta pulveracea]
MVQLKTWTALWAAAVSLCAVPALAATCARTYTAKAGDSCATVSAAYGITVTQFINLNPSLGTCALTPSTVYCVSDDPAAAAPTSTTTPPTGSLVPSPDGSEGICGNGYTCLGSVYGDCCSVNGYCGNSTDYCADGCNPTFGRCGGGTPPDTPGGPGTATPPPTTAIPGPTVTVTVTVTGAPGATLTRTVTPPPGTVLQTVTLSAITVTQTSTLTRLQTVTLAASTVVTTQIATATVTLPPSTVVQTATITKPITVTATVTATGPARPSPTLPGTYAKCKLMHPWSAP